MKMMVFGLLAILCISSMGHAQTPWPQSQASFRPAKANTAEEARLPATVTIKPPAADLPAALTGMGGKWTGSMGRGRTIAVKIAVESFHRAGAVATYASFGSFGHYAERLSMTWDTGQTELFAFFPGGHASIYLRLRPDNYLDVLFMQGQFWASGALSREPE